MRRLSISAVQWRSILLKVAGKLDECLGPEFGPLAIKEPRDEIAEYLSLSPSAISKCGMLALRDFTKPNGGSLPRSVGSEWRAMSADPPHELPTAEAI